MKLLTGQKDGGPESRVYAYGLEFKRLFSVLVLRFEPGSRDAYHSHAFDAVSWVLTCGLLEIFQGPRAARVHRPGWRPVVTRRADCHKVVSVGRTWVLSFRGPWADRWYDSAEGELTHGRRHVCPNYESVKHLGARRLVP